MLKSVDLRAQPDDRGGRSVHGLTITACVPANPESKGDSEATVRIAKGRPRPDGPQPARQLRLLRRPRACVRRVLRACQRARAPGHPARAGGDARRGTRPTASAAAGGAHGGKKRLVSWQSTISVDCALYSVPIALLDEWVWAGADTVASSSWLHAAGVEGPREVARHAVTTPGQPHRPGPLPAQAGGRPGGAATRRKHRRGAVPSDRPRRRKRG